MFCCGIHTFQRTYYIYIYIYIHIYIYTRKVPRPADRNLGLPSNGKHIRAPRHPLFSLPPLSLSLRQFFLSLCPHSLPPSFFPLSLYPLSLSAPLFPTLCPLSLPPLPLCPSLSLIATSLPTLLSLCSSVSLSLCTPLFLALLSLCPRSLSLSL